MTVHILGLGESLKEYTPDGNTTIGVNDIHGTVNTDYVVCVDHPSVFDNERLKAISKTQCKGFYSQINNWKHIPNFNKIDFNSGRGTLDGLDKEKFCYSNNSTYVAVILAYKLGAKSIIMHGVDFITHDAFKSHAFDRAIGDFKKLRQELNKRNVSLFVSSGYSALSKVMPILSGKS